MRISSFDRIFRYLGFPPFGLNDLEALLTVAREAKGGSPLML